MREQLPNKSGLYECPVCVFEMYVGAPTQEGEVVGETTFRATHTGCGTFWPLRTSHAVLAEEPKPKRRRWWNRGR